MKKFSIKWDSFQKGDFPKETLESLGFEVHQEKLDYKYSQITISSKETLTPEDIFYLGSITARMVTY